jgi:HEAT repeat protein
MASKKSTNKSAKKYSPVPPAVEKKAAPVGPTAPAAKAPVAKSIEAAPAAPVAAPVVAAPKLPDFQPIVLELQSPVARVRGAAAAKLGDSKNPAAVAPLIAALRDVDADAACDAAAALGTLGQALAVEPLIQVLTNTEDFFHSVVRAAAAHSLAKLRDARAVMPLLGAIRDPMAEASAEAIRALADIGDQRAVEPLIEVVENNDGYYANIVRRAAVLALAKLGGEKSINALRFVASNDREDDVIRNDAIDATR